MVYSKKNMITQKEEMDNLIGAIEGKETLSSASNKVSVKKELDDAPKDFAKLDMPSEPNPTKGESEFPVYPEMQRFSKKYSAESTKKLVKD
jgi:hypothetical protein